MNYLFISQADLKDKIQNSPNSNIFACLCGSRAMEAIADHDLKPRIKISCVVQGLGRGKVEVTSCSSDQVQLNIQIEEALPSRMPIDLVVAYSRPQTLKKLLHLASSLGVSSLSFVKTENVVPSYLQSKSLEPEAIRRQLILGCEQAGDGVFPDLNFFKYFHEFVKSELVTKRPNRKFFGEAGKNISHCDAGSGALLFLGPESGFTSKEKQDLESYGFQALSLGPRMLRVEIAAAMLLGKIGT